MNTFVLWSLYKILKNVVFKSFCWWNIDSKLFHSIYYGQSIVLRVQWMVFWGTYIRSVQVSILPCQLKSITCFQDPKASSSHSQQFFGFFFSDYFTICQIRSKDVKKGTATLSIEGVSVFSDCLKFLDSYEEITPHESRQIKVFL